MSVLPQNARMLKKHLVLKMLLFAALMSLLLGWLVYEKLFRVLPQPYAAGTVEAFKYGSIGAEEEAGIPYWIWLVLPRVFPEYLPGPGGYTSLGIVWEQGEEVPVGFSKKHIGFDRVGINCALCHTATFRTIRDDEDDKRATRTQIVPTGPSNRFDPQGYLSFLSRCADDPRFNADTLLEAIEYNIELSVVDKLLYRHLLIPRTRAAIRQQSAEGQWMVSRPLWGHGRIDPFNPVKFGMLEMADDATIGNSDMMPLWELGKRQAADKSWHLHWDGLVTDPVDASLAGALGDGATKKSLPVSDITKMVAWLKTYRPARSSRYREVEHPDDQLTYPYPNAIDHTAAEAGRKLFGTHCSRCHDDGGGQMNQPVTLLGTESIQNPYQARMEPEAIGTDSNRWKMWNPNATLGGAVSADERHPATKYNNYGNGYAWDLNSFVPTKGYVSVPLNGIWLRSPYLHNGSVPTLEDLLNPPMSKDELTKMMVLLNPILESVGATSIDLDRLAKSFSSVPAAVSPPASISHDLHQLSRFVDLTLKHCRLTGYERRPPFFYRGFDILDTKRVGFVHDSQAARGILDDSPVKSTSAERLRRFPVPFLTTVPGNSNEGHLYGTDLKAEEKKQLIEYLKTL